MYGNPSAQPQYDQWAVLQVFKVCKHTVLNWDDKVIFYTYACPFQTSVDHRCIQILHSYVNSVSTDYIKVIMNAKIIIVIEVLSFRSC